MNKLIHTAPPSALGRWLGSSVVWILVCTAGFLPAFYWVCSAGNGGKGGKFLFLVWLTAVQVMAWKKGVADFNLAYHNNFSPAETWLKATALFWLILLVSMLVWATLLCVFGWLLWAVTE